MFKYQVVIFRKQPTVITPHIINNIEANDEAEAADIAKDCVACSFTNLEEEKVHIRSSLVATRVSLIK